MCKNYMWSNTCYPMAIFYWISIFNCDAILQIIIVEDEHENIFYLK